MSKNHILILLLTLYAHITFAEEAYIENKGQITDQNAIINPAVLYLYNGNGLNLQLRKTGFSYDVWKYTGNSRIFNRVDIEFANASNNVFPEANKRVSAYLNYYTDNTHIHMIPGFEQIIYRNVWPGIDIQFSIKGNAPKYDFVLHPGAKSSDISLNITGAKNISIIKGNLLIATDITTIEEKIPRSYYTIKQESTDVTASFSKKPDGYYGIILAEKIPASCTLVIDPLPTTQWGSFFGGSAYEVNNAVTTDNKGYAYIVGRTESSANIATAGAYTSTLSTSSMGYLARFNSNGTLSWATYYRAGFISAVTTSSDAQYIYVAGTGSYLSKFDSSGAFIWNRPLKIDNAQSLALDSFGHIYVAGSAAPGDTEATTGTHQHIVDGATDGFIGKYRTSDGYRIWGTYYGGNYFDNINAIALSNGYIYAGGDTRSPTGIATIGALQAAHSGNPGANADICYSQWDTSGNLLYGTYLGGNPQNDICKRILADNNGNIYLSGYVRSAGLATSGAYQTTLKGSTNGFLMKMTAANTLSFFTYIGGLYETYADGMDIDTLGNILIAGTTESPADIATANATVTTFTAAINQIYMMKFNAAGRQYWGSYINAEYPFDLSLCVSKRNDIYIAGTGHGGLTIGTTGTHQPAYGGGPNDAFLMKFSVCQPGFAMASGTGTWNGGTILLSASGGHNYYWRGPASFVNYSQNPSIPNAQDSNSGIYTVVVIDTLVGCADKAQVNIQVSTDIKNVSADESFVLYPNPATNQMHLNIRLSQPLTLSFIITDITGKTVYSVPLELYIPGNSGLNINTVSLVAGNYVCKLIDDKGVAVWNCKMTKK